MIKFMHKFFGCTVESDLMTLNLPSVLPLTISNGSHSKTVYALIDSGSSMSFIKPETAKELKLISTKTKSEEFTVQVNEPNRTCSNKQHKSELILICESLPDLETSSVFYLIPEEIEKLFNITIHHLEEKNISLLIGTDQMTSLLMPPSLPFPKCISIAPNLSAIETPFGYYLQGYQFNRNTCYLLNWIQYSMCFFEDWKYVFVCLAADLILVFVLIFN